MIDIWMEIANLRDENRAGVLVTVVNKNGMGPSVVGQKMLVDDKGNLFGTIGGRELESQATKKARELLFLRKHDMESYNFSGDQPIEACKNLDMICGGYITLFFEYLSVRPSIYVIGMGHVGRCIADLMKNLDWRITLIDSRPEAANNMPKNYRILTGDFREVIHSEPAPQGCFIVIAGYSHEADYKVLKGVYQSGWNPGYIGLLASSKKAEIMVNKLAEELGDNIDLGVLHSPVGLDIGGSSPEEIAIAILAEIQAVRHGKIENKHLGKQWSAQNVKIGLG